MIANDDLLVPALDQPAAFEPGHQLIERRRRPGDAESLERRPDVAAGPVAFSEGTQDQELEMGESREALVSHKVVLGTVLDEKPAPEFAAMQHLLLSPRRFDNLIVVRSCPMAPGLTVLYGRVVDPRTEELIARRSSPSVSAKVWKGVRVVDAVFVWIKVRRRLIWMTSAVSFVLFAAAYQTQINQPAELKARAEFDARSADRIRTEATDRSAALDRCLTKADEEATERWKAACRREGKRAGCVLSRERTEALRLQENGARNACLLKYPHQ